MSKIAPGMWMDPSWLEFRRKAAAPRRRKPPNPISGKRVHSHEDQSEAVGAVRTCGNDMATTAPRRNSNDEQCRLRTPSSQSQYHTGPVASVGLHA